MKIITISSNTFWVAYVVNLLMKVYSNLRDNMSHHQLYVFVEDIFSSFCNVIFFFMKEKSGAKVVPMYWEIGNMYLELFKFCLWKRKLFRKCYF